MRGQWVSQKLDILLSKPRNVFIILSIFAFICYGRVIKGPFFFDDEHFIVKNQTIHSLKNISKIYTSSVTAAAYIRGNFYRPHQQLVYAILYHFFKLNPLPYHIVPIILHLFNTFLIFILLNRLFFSKISAFWAALVFLIHPIQTEAVSYISGLADPLGLFFLLAGMIQFLKSLTTMGRVKQILGLIFSVSLFVIALFTKENMVVLLPLSIIISLYIYKRINKPTNKFLITSILIFGLVTVFYMGLRFSIFNFSESIGLTEEKNLYTGKLYIRIITFLNILWEYAKMLIYPRHLYYEKPYTAYANLISFRAGFGIILIGIFLFTCAHLRKYQNIFLGLGWFFVSLVPYSGIIPLNAIYLEHWLYVPIIGILILLASLYEFLARLKKEDVLLMILLPLSILYMTRTFLRNAEWSNIEKFYLNELRYTNSAVRIYNNLGMYYADKKNYSKAIDYYNKAIQSWDAFAQPHHNLANIYFERGEIENAINELYSALKIEPNFIYSLNKLYEIYLSLNQDKKAAGIQELILNLEKGKKNDFREIENIIFSP